MPEEEQLTFEAALQKLEEVVQALEGEGLTLEDSLAYYQEGIRLVRLCRQRLKEVEGKLQVILLQDGEVVTRELSLPGGENHGT
ncbi:exodeoxyribonuclease VII small subunit [Neomoorella thermoacetica]|uniref:Exodeoxyribonuclease 7 small subunit n=3 Tax=Neomoorella thermoacetica TaxID=1525 RepID=EX7S_MOOTA|nr:exodeoxyribonuclease VII small subunit [Moorella thermoacetica]Q2RIB6.1 RecName: Full=Exodeoxyribonuclease 7 small subunit; AltName: Full=Exodeoxyribonuclease VII small subunit; Short=Exonuclease VII small subunit [Moorella thermoacetica ATCC 39073]AKX94298.1 exodeoxyribonuclease 7 small subunit [Moorella thermoacetica]AKX96935.1 exodeoxyribonuclease 7 small subunit [Moorella thermoacetica]AOQ24245.1 Exodeoxyribonuclease 7 small subunit [Moorella thermoacetica]APC08724.1 exodeoxyribonucleas